jgi:hypothetical protein
MASRFIPSIRQRSQEAQSEMQMTNDTSKPRYVLEPFVGVGAVRFGMTRAQVAKALGAPGKVNDNDIVRKIDEIRDGVVFEYWYDDKRTLGAMALPKQASITFEGLDIMKGADALAALKRADPTWKDHGQYLHFPALGVLLGGFGKRRIPEGKLVIVYGRSRASFYTGFATA